MPIFDTARLQPEGMGLERFPASLGERLGAEAEGAIEGLPIRELTDTAHLLGAKGVQAPIGNPMGDYTGPFDAAEEERQNAAALPDVPIEEARAKVKAAGLDRHLALPDQPSIKSPALDIMIDRANARRERDATIARGPQGFIPGALSFGTGFFLPLLDPLNDAAFMIPVVGEARGARMLAAAGDSMTGRVGVRFGIGAAQGAVGTAALQPLEAWARTQEGQDFTAAEALRNVMFGAGLAGTMHGGLGLVGDAWARAHGRAFEPATELGAPNRGAPQRAPNEAGEAEFESGISEPAEPMPAAIAQALPTAAHRDAMQGALASLVDGEPVQAAEHLEAAGRQDPRVAEGLAQVFEAWHGSPHDFEAFDVGKIGTGEGNQAFGHGLYFAENPEVATGYRDKLSTGNLADPRDVAATYLKSFSDRKTAIQSLRDNADTFAEGDAIRAEVLRKAADLLDGGFVPKPPGALYRIRIKADRERFLDWDKPMSEQSEFVRNAIENHPNPMIAGTAAKWGHDISAMYNRIAVRLGGEGSGDIAAPGTAVKHREGAPLASEALREAGIPGIKYYDQGSRNLGLRYEVLSRGDGSFDLLKHLGGGEENIGNFPTREAANAERERVMPAEGTRNYVVFHHNDVEITHKNGAPVDRKAALADDWHALAAARGRDDAEAKVAAPGPEELKEPDSIKAEAETEPENKILPPRSAEGGEGADRSAQAAETGGSKEQSSTEAGKVQAPAAVSPATKAAIDAEDRGRADFEARGGDDNWELKPGETLGDALAAIDRDTMELSEIVTRGAACLAAAVGA